MRRGRPEDVLVLAVLALESCRRTRQLTGVTGQPASVIASQFAARRVMCSSNLRRKVSEVAARTAAPLSRVAP